MRVREAALEVAALGEFGCELEGYLTIRCVAIAEPDHGEAGVQNSAVAKGVLVTDVGQPRCDVRVHGALLRNESGEAVVGRVVIVEEEAGSEDVGLAEIDLR